MDPNVLRTTVDLSGRAIAGPSCGAEYLFEKFVEKKKLFEFDCPAGGAIPCIRIGYGQTAAPRLWRPRRRS